MAGRPSRLASLRDLAATHELPAGQAPCGVSVDLAGSGDDDSFTLVLAPRPTAAVADSSQITPVLRAAATIKGVRALGSGSIGPDGALFEGFTTGPRGASRSELDRLWAVLRSTGHPIFVTINGPDGTLIVAASCPRAGYEPGWVRTRLR